MPPDYPRNITDCIRKYGTLQVAVDPDLYILEDASGSFINDMENLRRLSGELVDTLALMFDTYRIGLGTFIDVGAYCFKSEVPIQADMTGAQLNEHLRRADGTITGTSGVPMMFNQGFCPHVGRGWCHQGNCFCTPPTPFSPSGNCPAPNIDENPYPDAYIGYGEAMTAGLLAVGEEHAALGFQSTTLRMVLTSTDDFFKQGYAADCSDGTCMTYGGADPAAPGYATGCVHDETTGQNNRCGRIPSVSEVRAALESSAPPIQPIFAIANWWNDDSLTGTGDSTVFMRQQYREMMTLMGHNASKYVMDLASDSSNFIEVLVRALRLKIGDLPRQCFVEDECRFPDPACPNCEDTPYGPRICGECEAGVAKDLDGACTVDIDECCSQPCLHGGGCTDGLISYTCACTSGFSGENCEDDVDECTQLSPTCHADSCDRCHPFVSVDGYPFGGVCHESGEFHNEEDVLTVAPGQYACGCPPGFTGSDCQEDINECLSSPCGNGAACSESNDVVAAGTPADGPTLTSNTASCVFPFTYRGVTYNSCSYVGNGNVPWCSTAVDSAGMHIATDTADVNQNHITCVFDTVYDMSIYGNYTCACGAGYTGTDCRIDVDECASMPCLHGGVCRQPVPNSYYCECVLDFSGVHCEIQEEEDYTVLLIIALLALLLCCLASVILFVIRRNKANTITFLVETLDQEAAVQGSYDQYVTIEVVMKKHQSVGDLCQELKLREGIPLLEQRLFVVDVFASDGEMLQMTSTLPEAGVFDGTTVKLLQVWQLKVHDVVADPSAEKLHELPVVERHWSIESIMVEVENAIGIPDLFRSAELSFHGIVLREENTLPDYPMIVNGAVIKLTYEEDSFDERQLAAPKANMASAPLAVEIGMSANSVVTMADMFAKNQVPGAHLSELQNRGKKKAQQKNVASNP